MSKKVRVLVVDDSAYNRRTIVKMLEVVPGIEVVGYACDGEEGLRKFFDLEPDLVTLDLEMPRMDGFTFLRVVMQKRHTPVIVVSARSEDSSVFKALELGAVEFVTKPPGKISPALANIRDDLVRKVRQIACTDMNKILARSLSALGADQVVAGRSRRKWEVGGEGPFRQIVIGASTGGPPALQQILSAIKGPIPVGIAISQHMPPGFTRAFAERLDKVCALEVREARSGDVMKPGRVLISPGGKNLLFRSRGDKVVASVVSPGPDQRYVPSVDVMFASASEAFGPSILGVVLTGMGNDGAKGIIAIKDAGGATLAEAEESSVVFGMPKEAIATGKVDQVVALPRMGEEILRWCEAGRRR
ncbi:MAG: chemotaxis response regulator protein-glutamate methylesterase [Desulfuromonas sp.]|uniref:protein-glutamate methylesterase/protein-glutamine glutaminase n=1 Tax=Desulfuromonas sp. TaxID=892 RepID=UPI000CB1CA53|nr:chemotaxis response regulator protein-glutamate methylesterase [Desulfuromonas sp.]PLX82571.1 MAG: chemotaxis response regulator protein-glutamate methylesterase [Desulfuromonas sp.]